jgi:hypothetical protein
MSRQLVRFWFGRFLRILWITAIALIAMRYAGLSVLSNLEMAIWAGIAAVLSASINTYWMYRRSCRVQRRVAVSANPSPPQPPSPPSQDRGEGR